MIRYRLPIVLMLMLILAGCSAMDDTTVDPHTMQRLVGAWHQVDDGSGNLVFYADESVKVDLPDEHPPLRLLSSVEKLKDHRIAFSIGDRWTEPAYIELSTDGNSLKLEFPPTAPNKDDGRTIDFKRVR